MTCPVGGVLTFAQGMAILTQASRTYDYGLNLETVARIWRGGCTGVPGQAWQEQPLPDVEVRDLAVYDRVSSLEAPHD